MIRHIVFWTLRGDTPEEKAKNARDVKNALESLNGKIPGMLTLQVGMDFSRTPDSSDVVLYSEFVSREALDAYQAHPEHLKVKPGIKAVRLERRTVDYDAG